MRRTLDMQAVSDGRTYTANDMVKADCGGCTDCHLCCTGMGASIVLDPYDVFNLCRTLKQSFSQLLEQYLEVQVVDHVILPNLKMTGPREACSFLNEAGRCSIHSVRPGICRLFPLGRIYEDEGFAYFLQVHECPKENKKKIKVREWLSVPNLKSYEAFVCQWHQFLRDAEHAMLQMEAQDVRELNMFILQSFYGKAYDVTEDFYSQFEARLTQAKKLLAVL